MRVRWLEPVLLDENVRRKVEAKLSQLADVELGDYEETGEAITLHLDEEEGLHVKLAKLEGKLVILAARWECGGFVEETIVGEVE